jgi:hypothetical protein
VWFNVCRFMLESVGGALPALPNHRVSGALGEVSIPGGQFPQFCRILNGGPFFPVSILGPTAQSWIDMDQSVVPQHPVSRLGTRIFG